MRKRPKSKAKRDLVTVLIVYASRQRPHARHELKAGVRRGTVIDTDHATGLVAVRMGLQLNEVRIVRVEPYQA